MADSNDPVPDNTTIQKKKPKKKKKKSGGKTEKEIPEQSRDQPEKQPQQTSDHDETIMRTTKCSYCGKNVRQLLRGFKNPENVNPGPVVCELCVRTISQQKEDYRGGTLYSQNDKVKTPTSVYRSSGRKPVLNETLCNCVACVSKRENTVNPEVERDAHITQSYWMEIRHIVRCIYRENMSLSAIATRENIGSDKMRIIVRKLCCRDPHQFFQRLETLAREYLLEVKVRLLEQLSCGFNSPQLAIEFIQMLLNEYSSLCIALPALLYLLEPLEETEYVRRLGVTIELVNKNIFRELIFAESFMSSNLPLIIAQLRLASLSSDPFHRSTADALSQRYNNLDDEMDMIGNVWNTAKNQLKQQQEDFKKREERRAHIEKILNDGESFKKHTKKEQHQEVYTTTPLQASTEKIKEDSSNNTSLSHSCNTNLHVPTVTPSLTPHNDSSITTTTTSLSIPHSNTDQHHSSMLLDNPEEDGWLSKEQVTEWSKILFKCIKPIGDPEFRITDNIATHTITLKIDMTAIDLQHAESVCTQEQVEKYEQLGMRREEIAEVALKLNAIKHLGINLRIDDLFDEHGFVIVDGNESNEEREDAVYFVEEGKNSVKGKEKLLVEEMNRSGLVNLQREKDNVIYREKSEVGEGRETDLLQSMTMKIRFMKSVSDEEMKTRLMSDSEQVMFESCDQVQMKLTQLELNTMRLMCGNKSLASNLGIRKRRTNDSSSSEERFVHTDTHQPFVGLLLEQGKQAEQMKKEKEELKALASIDRANEQDSSSCPQQLEEHETDKIVMKIPEQVTGKESTGIMKSSGVCIPNPNQSCQCFACIGAVAAQITEGSLRPLNPVDPTGSKLTIKGVMNAKLHVTENGDTIKECIDDQSTKSTSSKAEHLWHNWMSTSEISHTPSNKANDSSPQNQLDTTNNSPSPEQPSTPVTNSSSNENEPNGSDTPQSCSSSACCDGTTPTCTADGHHHHSATQKNSGNGSVKRYCPCCYCELFGQNTPTVPTSHNYTKQRDKMRQKLEKKRKQEHVHCHHQHACHHHHHEEPCTQPPVEAHQEHQHHYYHHHHHQQEPQEPLPTPSPPPSTFSSMPVITSDPVPNKKEKTLDEILQYIEGKDFNGSDIDIPPQGSVNLTKTKKKKKSKKKLERETVLSNGCISTSPSINSNSISTVYNTTSKKDDNKPSAIPQHQNGGPPQKKVSQSPVSQHMSKSNCKVNNSPKPVHRKASKPSGQNNGLSKSSSGKFDNQHLVESSSFSDVDEVYDRELEEFKKY